MKIFCSILLLGCICTSYARADVDTLENGPSPSTTNQTADGDRLQAQDTISVEPTKSTTFPGIVRTVKDMRSEGVYWIGVAFMMILMFFVLLGIALWWPVCYLALIAYLVVAIIHIIDGHWLDAVVFFGLALAAGGRSLS